jgi:5-methyltetrahydropteroyltriglutamate--homocysteine methyltransferase
MYEGYIVGIFPRNDSLIDTWKKWERGTVDDGVFREVLDEALDYVVRNQVVVGLSYVHDPQIDWHDMFRPFTELENVSAGPLTRFFENNTFFRKPVIRDVVEYEKGFINSYVHRDKMPKGRRWIVTLPGPYTFYRLSEYRDGDTGRKSIVNMVSGAMDDLLREGYEFIVLAEPALAYYSDVDWDIVSGFYKPLRETGLKYRIHLYFGDVKDRISRLMEIAPYGFSIDTSYTSLEELEGLDLDTLVLGVVDAQNTLMENVDDTVNKIRSLREKLGCRNIAITNNTDFDYLPYEVAEAKLMLLSEVLRRLGA